MPANLPPQFIEARTKFEQSKDLEEKIELLQYMLAIIPKHKGTNKLIGELRSRLASLRREARTKPPKRKHYDPYNVPRQGAGQVIIIGPPNVGKSRLITRLTNASSLVAPYPFSTDKPVVGMMPYENIRIQLVDTPPISDDIVEPQLLELIRRSDLVLFVVDLSNDDLLDQIESILSRMQSARIKLTMHELEVSDSNDEVSFDSVIDQHQVIEDYLRKKTIMVANKMDAEGSQERLSILKELYSNEFPIIAISAETDEDFNELKKLIFEQLKIVRVYTKPIGRKPDLTDPIILHQGSVVIDAAVEIHRDFAENLKFAKIWNGKKYNGQRVGRDHPLEDGDILEFHTSD